MKVKDLCTKVALDLNLPPKYVWEVYKSYWKAIRNYMSSLPLKELSEEDLGKIRTNINIPSLGKFFIDLEGLNRKKQRYEGYSNKKT